MSMSSHRWTPAARRVAAAFATALFVGGPALAASPAYAADGQSVEFSGGSVLSMLVCKSQPSAAQVTVASEGRVVFVNRLGQSATLRVDGHSVASVGANQAVPVVFHYGPVTVSMALSCNVGVVQQFQSVVVNVARPVAAGGTATAAGGAGASARAATTARPGGTPTGEHSAVAAAPTDDQTAAGLEPGLDPSGDVSASAGADAAAAPADPAGAGPVAVGPIVTASGTPRVRASGLLTLLATVCAIGVTVAAIRAIVAQRTTRTRFA
jgi:hypothetical protein